MSPTPSIEELTAEVARLDRENHKLFSQFAGCSAGIKRLYEKLRQAHYENGVLQSERDELQYHLNQFTQNAA